MLALLQRQRLLKDENICRGVFQYFNDKVLGMLGV
jgi:hypothetical protein